MFSKPKYVPPTQAEIDDWEYRPSHTGVAGETKLAMGVVTLLMLVFGVIVWQRLTPTSHELIASTDGQLKPFVYGQTPEEDFSAVPTLAEENPFLASASPLVEATQNPPEPTPTLSESEVEEVNPFASPSTLASNPFAEKSEPVPPMNSFVEDAKPQPIPFQVISEVETAMPTQAATESSGFAFDKPEVETNEPAAPQPLEIAQVETAKASFFAPTDPYPASEPTPQKVVEQAAPSHFFEDSSAPKQTEAANPFMVTEPEPAPFEPAPETQMLAVNDPEPEPQLVEPVPLQLTPVKPAPQQPLPTFEPLVLPEEPDIASQKPVPVPAFGSEFDAPTQHPKPHQPVPLQATPPQALPSFDQPNTSPQPTPSFNPVPQEAPAFAPVQQLPLNHALRNSMTAEANTSLRSPAEEEVNEKIYEVVEGDNYWSISRKNYGKARYFSALAEYNKIRIPRPERMKPGMKVLIPDEKVLQQRYPKLVGIRVVDANSEAASQLSGEPGFFVDQDGQPMYRVGKGDTLTEIAQKHLGRSSRWVQIHGMNQDTMPSANTLKIGTVLRLPRDASQVARALR